MSSSEIVRARNRLAKLHNKSSKATDADREDARRELAATKLRVYVTDVLASAPPLSPAQRQTIIALLRDAAMTTVTSAADAGEPQ